MKEFRDNIIESDGFKCTSCGRGRKDGSTLQVHHKVYHKGKLPWQYGTKDLTTLCKGCHAAEHGKIQPQTGWDYLAEEDLCDILEVCQNGNCGTRIRYTYLISHPNWGFLIVGTNCCDNLTDTRIASNNRESVNKYKGRIRRFIASSRWKFEGNVYWIKQAGFKVEIEERSQGFFLTIHNLESKKPYPSLEDAQSRTFEVIESGELIEYLEKNGISYP